MAGQIFQIEMPDGKLIEVEGAPDQNAALDFVRRQYQAQGQQKAPEPNYPTGPIGAAGNAIARSWNRAQETVDQGVADYYGQSARDAGKGFTDILREEYTVNRGGSADKPYDVLIPGPSDLLGAGFRYFSRSSNPEADMKTAQAWQRAAAAQKAEAGQYPMTRAATEQAQRIQEGGWGTLPDEAITNPMQTLSTGLQIGGDQAVTLGAGYLARRVAGPRAAAAVMGGSGFAQERYNVLEFLKDNGVDVSKPEELDKAVQNDALMQKAADFGFERGKIIGVVDLATGRIASAKMSKSPTLNLAGQTTAQAAGDAVGETAAQLATTGKVKPGDVALEVLGGMGTAPIEAIGVGGQKVSDVVPGVQTLQGISDDKGNADSPDAAARVAARINLYEADGFDPMNLDPSAAKGAKEILTGINKDIAGELKELKKTLAPLLDPKNDSTIDDVINRAALTTVTQKGVNRLKTGMTEADIQKIEGLVGHTQEGAVFVEKLKEAREVGRLYKSGVKGGLSRFTDSLSVFTRDGDGGVNLRNLISIGAGYGSGGAITLAQLGISGLGRGVDAITGNRSRVARYVRDYGNPNVLSPNITPPQGLRSLTGEQEAARLQAEALQQARQQARAQAAQIRVAENERKNKVIAEQRRLIRDHIRNGTVPGGGIFKVVHDRHGLNAGQVAIGLNSLVQSGRADPEIARMFIDEPEALMQGNVGNAYIDMLGKLADEGKLQRDPDWKPQAAQGPTTGMPGAGPTMTSATRQAPMDERRRIAYEQQARANQDRVSQTINAIQADQRIPEAIKPRLLEAAALIGKTNNKQEAQKIADGVDKALSFDTPLKMIAQSYLQPLVDQIRHAIDPNGPKPQAMRRSEAKITKARTEALVKGVVAAANAIDKVNSFSENATQSGTVDLNTLTPSQRGRSAIEILRGPDAKKGSRTVTEVAKALQERARADGRGKWTVANRTAKIDDELGTMIASEAIEELGNSRNASDWYSREMQKALNAAALIHPELKSDPIARMVFNLALAITSQGVVVSDNANYAMRWYEAYKDSIPAGSTDFKGKFPEEGWGKAAPSIIANARKINAMIEKNGTQDTMDFLNAQFTVKELEDAGFKIGGENKGTLVWGSAILGPKIGNGFYQNLAGNFSPVTIDMWLMRLWGRMTGNSIGIEEAAQKKQETRLREALKGDNYFDPSMYESTEGLFEVAEEIFRDWEREFRQYGSKGLKDGTIVKTEKIKAAERLLHGRDQPIDAPSSAAVRNWIRDVMNIAQAKLQAQGVNVTNADLQAIIWYPEKRLWTKKMGSREKGSGEDGAQSAGETSYMHEFARIARERGFTDAEIQQAIQSPSGAGSGSGPVRSASGRTDAQSGQVDGTNEAQAGSWSRKDELLAGALAINKGLTPDAAKAARQAALAKEAMKKAGKGKKK